MSVFKKLKISKHRIIPSAVVLVVILASAFLFIRWYQPQKDTPLLRTDAEPLIVRFGETLDITSCAWKAGIINGSGIGPSSYWMKGFIETEKDSFNSLISQYEIVPANVQFDNDIITTDVLDFEEYNWGYNSELSKRIIGVGYVGVFYVDIQNCLFYFDIESN